MTDVRKRALRNGLLALLLMAPVWWYLGVLDRDASLWRPHPAFFVALLTPGFLVVLRAGYALIFGRPGPFPLFGPKPADW